MRYTWILAAVLAVGCVSEPTRQLNHLNGLAAEKIVRESSEPPIQEVAIDIAKNSASIGTAIGYPRNPEVSYAASKSEEWRQKQEEAISRTNWWKDVATKGLAGLLGLFGVALPPILVKFLQARKKLGSIYGGLEQAWEVLGPKAKEVKDILRETAKEAGVRESIKKDIKAVRKV